MSNGNISIIDENEEIILIDSDEEKIQPNNNINGYWKVLIIDDDEYVHSITKLSLNDLNYASKDLELLSAYSAKEAIEVLKENTDIALVFVDVVMEEDDSGLKLVKYIRGELSNKLIRIILRTGQPGQAPEKRVIVEYDINDYKLKTELTADKLYVTVVSALRSYSDLVQLEQSRYGLEKIISSSTEMFKEKSLNIFISSILEQLVSLISSRNETSFNQPSGFIATKSGTDYIIQSAIGEFTKYINKGVKETYNFEITQKINEVKNSNKNLYSTNNFMAYFKGQFDDENIIYMKFDSDLSDLDKELITMFLTNIYIALDNLYIDQEMAATQKEIIYTLGEISEARSQEIGNHVKRVAEYSKLLAIKYGLPDEEAELIKLAAPMHDVGKLVIPDTILNKPGKLTDEEFEIMKSHAKAGYDVLKGSNGTIMKLAAIIAHQHHEKYNGKGYPSGLKGKEISIYGRISAISDVFDALGSDRVYKKAWPLDKIINLFKEERGEHFDPELIDIFLDNIDDFIKIMNKLKD